MGGPLTRRATVTPYTHTTHTTEMTTTTTTAQPTLKPATGVWGRTMGELARNVLATVRRHAAGISTVGVTGEAELPPDTTPENVAKTLANLRQQGYIVNTGRRGGSGLWMCTTSHHAKAHAPKAHPGGALDAPKNKTAERTAVEACLRSAGPLGATRERVRSITGLPSDVVHKVCKNLCAAGKAELVSHHGGDAHVVLLACLASAEARTRMALAPRINKLAGTYDPVELRPNPGIGPERFAAFLLPSRIGNRLHHPDGRVEELVQA